MLLAHTPRVRPAADVWSTMRTAFSNVLLTTRAFSNLPFDQSSAVVVPARAVDGVAEHVVLERHVAVRRLAPPVAARDEQSIVAQLRNVELRIVTPGDWEMMHSLWTSAPRWIDVVELDVVDDEFSRRGVGAAEQRALLVDHVADAAVPEGHVAAAAAGSRTRRRSRRAAASRSRPSKVTLRRRCRAGGSCCPARRGTSPACRPGNPAGRRARGDLDHVAGRAWP